MIIIAAIPLFLASSCRPAGQDEAGPGGDGGSAADDSASDGGTGDGGTGDGGTGDGGTGVTEHRLIYTTKCSSSWDLETAAVDGSDRQPLVTTTDTEEWWPRVSPDGLTVLFYRSPAGTDYATYEQAELWAVDIDGSDERRIIALDDHDWAAQGVVAWHPDGTQLIMAASIDDGAGVHWQLVTTATDGSDLRRITTQRGLFGDPSWSPDGSRIVYTALPAEHRDSGLDALVAKLGLSFGLTVRLYLEIHTADPDGSDELRLTEDDRGDFDPAWSPDGTTIAFESTDEGTSSLLGWSSWSLRAVTAEEPGATSLLTDGMINTVPRWTPEGTILFSRGMFTSLDPYGLYLLEDGVPLAVYDPDDCSAHSAEVYMVR